MKPRVVYSRDLNEEKIFKLNHELLHYDWETIEVAPVKIHKISSKQILREKWMSKSLQNCSRRNNKLFKKQIGLSKDSPEHIRYLKYRNMFNRVKLLAKKSYYKELIDQHKDNARKLWSIVNDLSCKSNDKSSIIRELLHNGKSVQVYQEFYNRREIISGVYFC